MDLKKDFSTVCNFSHLVLILGPLKCVFSKWGPNWMGLSCACIFLICLNPTLLSSWPLDEISIGPSIPPQEVFHVVATTFVILSTRPTLEQTTTKVLRNCLTSCFGFYVTVGPVLFFMTQDCYYWDKGCALKLKV